MTGSRDWQSELFIARVMVDLRNTLEIRGVDALAVTLVSGGCPTGADRMAERCAAFLGWFVERHPADWGRYGKQAGFVRNAEMVALGADVCLAFIRANSPGASTTVRMAQTAGIQTTIYREGPDTAEPAHTSADGMTAPSAGRDGCLG
ncbi:SLOG family protein [Micromonospora sp. WMMA1363]|uniref:SLOG family protein n=1 Tax=Micromonospora sp. WMMA1363 TaxID=3053985 RepID=UPI00338D9560